MAGYSCETTKTGVEQSPAGAQTEWVSLTGGEKKEVSFTNTYTRISHTVKVTKSVDGNMGDTSEQFEFDIWIDGSKQESFKLSGGQSKEFPIHQGSALKIEEKGAAEDGYTIRITATGNANTSQTQGTYEAVITEKTEIVYRNTREVVPTGLRDNVIPFSMMLLTAAAGTVWFGLTGRRKRSA